MTEPNDNLDRALEALQAQTPPQGPPTEVIQQTLAALTDQYGPTGVEVGGEQSRPVSHQSHWRWAAAAIVLLMVGFTVGQVCAQFRLERNLTQWQQQVKTDLQQDLLQIQQAQLVQVAQQVDQGLIQRFNEFANGALAMNQSSQRQFLMTFDRLQEQQRQQLIQLLGQWQEQQLMHNAVLADGLVTVADVTESLLVPEQREPSRQLILDPNSLQQ